MAVRSISLIAFATFSLVAVGCSSGDSADNVAAHQDVTANAHDVLSASDSQKLIALLDKAGVEAIHGASGQSWSTDMDCTTISGVNAVCSLGPKARLNGADAKQAVDLLEKAGIQQTNGAAGVTWSAHASCNLVNGASATCHLTREAAAPQKPEDAAGQLNGSDSDKLVDLLEKAGIEGRSGAAGVSWSARVSCTLVNGANATCRVGDEGSLSAADAEQAIDLLGKAGVKAVNGAAGVTWSANASCTQLNGTTAICNVE
jgi:hypothetical protein